MKKIYRVLLLTLILTIITFGFSTVYAYENFIIEKYVVLINVLENNVVEVDETIYADFIYDSHGIYRDIPVRGIFSRIVNGELIENKYRAIISDIEVEDYKYTVENNGNNGFW